MISNIEDMNDQFDNVIEDIQKAIVNKSDEAGITKQMMYEFKEFDIQDTYMANGTFCYACKKGNACEKHGLERQDRITDNNLKLPFHMTKEIALK